MRAFVADVLILDLGLSVLMALRQLAHGLKQWSKWNCVEFSRGYWPTIVEASDGSSR